MRTVKKTLCLVLVLSMMLGFAAISAAAQFTDAEDIELTEAAEVLNEIGVLTGYEDGSFQPGGFLTREEGCAIIARLLGYVASDITVAPSFKDVNEWSKGYVAFCEQKGIVSGYGDGFFGPKDQLTGGQFMKMLLVALGYDAEREGMSNNGENWILVVASKGREAGLDDDVVADLADFPYTAPVTREQAAQMALNALCAPMVQYTTAGNIEYITTTRAETQTISNETVSNTSLYFIELGEKYFPLLVLRGVHDDFFRPADKWTYKNKTVGVYADNYDYRFTTAVTPAMLYSEMELTDKIPMGNITVYVDGQLDIVNTADIVRTDVVTHYGASANGSITEVFYDELHNTVTIVVINVYTGMIGNVYTKTSTRDASVSINQTIPGTYTAPAGVANLSFNTEGFAVGDRVIYTYSFAAGRIVTMEAADKVTGKLETSTSNVSVTLDGTKYLQNVNGGCPLGDPGASRIGTEITIFLDKEGYVVYTGFTTITNYGVVVGLSNSGQTNISGSKIRMINTKDASNIMGDLTSVKGMIAGSSAEYAADMDEAIANVGAGDYGRLNIFDIVKYEGSYAVTLLADAYTVTNSGSSDVALVTKGSAKLNSLMNTYGVSADGKALPVTNSSCIEANGSTAFVVMTINADGSYTYTTYKGIANVPTMTLAAGKSTVVSVYVDTPSDNTADIVFILNGAGLTVDTSTKDLVFIIGDKNVGKTTDAAGTTFYQYKAIVNGALVEEFKTVAQYTVGTLISSPSYDSKGRLMAATAAMQAAPLNDSSATNADTLAANHGTYVHYAVSMTKLVEHTARFVDQLGAAETYAISNDVKVVVIDGADVQTGGYEMLSVVTSKDAVWYNMNANNIITQVFVVVGASSSSSTAKDFYTFFGKGTLYGKGNSKSIYADVWNTTAATITATITIYTKSNSSGVVTSAPYTYNIPAYGFASDVDGLDGIYVENSTTDFQYWAVIEVGGTTETYTPIYGG